MTIITRLHRHSLYTLFLIPLLACANEPVSLMDAYTSAQSHDAAMQAAFADNSAQKEGVDMAFSQFLPQARISAFKGRGSTDRETVGLPGTRHFVYDNENYAFTVRQSIYSKSNQASYSQAKAIASKSDAVLEKEKSALTGRVIGNYLNLLLSAENIAYADRQKLKLESQVDQAKKRYQGGIGTITEISEAEANLELVNANQLEFINNLEFSKRTMENLTGLEFRHFFLLDPNRLPLTKPDPADVQHWIGMAESNNPELKAQLNEVEASRQEIEKNLAGHYPTLDALASRTISESDANNTIGSKFETDTVGLQLNMPIYSGGYVNASVRRAQANLLKAQETLTDLQRQIAVQTRKFYNDVVNGLARIQALDASVRSYESALAGTEKGFAAGLRTNIDVLNAQDRLYSAKRELAKERYNYIFSKLQLKLVSGIFTQADIEESSTWLSLRP
jgi:protease secretion system outer membrane protein